ncbi:ADP-ribosylation [Heliocybe sulcata]|uniref:ADP-ribosylation n=1 Tax=Heliocybe sulcata TaxID=5364 RepID=A0A5C3MVG2_9AGAM|nr:ADP-ribosylation [Heliocybe sulcata]
MPLIDFLLRRFAHRRPVHEQPAVHKQDDFHEKSVYEEPLCIYPDCHDAALRHLFPSNEHGGIPPSSGDVLVEIADTDPKYKDILHQFDEKWLHSNKPKPKVHHIYKVSVPESVTAPYEKYKDDITKKRGIPNERRRCHGTKRACELGEGGGAGLCTSAQCSLCGILRTGFKLELAGGHKPWKKSPCGRFGRGIYTSATSSKSDDYSCDECPSLARHKAMLLTKVVVGNGKKLKKDDPSLTSPPEGYDSVIGEPAGHEEGALNYDELIVYSNHAVIPAYLIIYGDREPVQVWSEEARHDGKAA